MHVAKGRSETNYASVPLTPLSSNPSLGAYHIEVATLLALFLTPYIPGPEPITTSSRPSIR